MHVLMVVNPHHELSLQDQRMNTRVKEFHNIKTDPNHNLTIGTSYLMHWFLALLGMTMTGRYRLVVHALSYHFPLCWVLSIPMEGMMILVMRSISLFHIHPFPNLYNCCWVDRHSVYLPMKGAIENASPEMRIPTRTPLAKKIWSQNSVSSKNIPEIRQRWRTA